MNTTLLLAAGAGIIGTGVGGVLGLFFATGSNKILSKMLAFSAGIMVSIVSFELMPEAMFLSNVFTASAGMIAGIYVMILLNNVVEKLSPSNKKKAPVLHGRAKSNEYSGQSLYRLGVMMFLAISLHNLPEGIAIGSGGSYNPALGAEIALVIALHDIPEGMAISAPLVAAGMGGFAAASLSALSGASTLVGAALGFTLGGISQQVTSVSIASAGGAMLYVVFGEIFPESLEMVDDRSPTLYATVGFIIGMIVALH